LSRLGAPGTVDRMRARDEVTPEHVGRRVSFQYELPNGYLSEAVGILKWFDEAAQTYMLEDRNGKLHRVPRKGVRHSRVVS
jgi:hypothetical protein